MSRGSSGVARAETHECKLPWRLVLGKENVTILKNCWSLSVDNSESLKLQGTQSWRPLRYCKTCCQELDQIPTPNTSSQASGRDAGRGTILKQASAPWSSGGRPPGETSQTAQSPTAGVVAEPK